jgi:hypothetical protein
MGRRAAHVLVSVAIGAGGVGLGAGPADAASDTCNGTISNKTISANLTVPSGASCVLDRVTVNGNVYATNVKQFLIMDTSIFGTLTINGITDTSATSGICGVTVSKNLYVQNVAAGVTTDGEQYSVGDDDCGSLDVIGNTLVAGNAADVAIEHSHFHGNLAFNNNTGPGSAFEEDTVDGRLSCSGNSPPPDATQVIAGSKTGQCA